VKTETFKALAETAYGKKLAQSIEYPVEYDAYTSYAEVVSANDLLSEQETVDTRNTQRKANARQKALQVALDAAGIVKPTIENDSQMRLRKMYDLFMANGASSSEARIKASNALGIEWTE